MKKLSTLLLLLPSLAKASGDFLGTKSDPIPAPVNISPITGSSMVQMLIVLAAVLAIVKFGMPRIMAMFGNRLVTGTTANIRIEESASFPGGNLYVVRARNKTLLLGVANAGIQCLADLTEPHPLEKALTFQEMLESAPGMAPESSVNAVVETQDISPASQELARILRLTQ